MGRKFRSLIKVKSNIKRAAIINALDLLYEEMDKQFKALNIDIIGCHFFATEDDFMTNNLL